MIRFLNKILLFLLVSFTIGEIYIFAQSNDTLVLTPDDIKIEDAEAEGGIYVYIRKKIAIRSVLLTESAEREDNALATYAYRTYSYYPENGDENRILDGKFISTKTGEGYYIIDSTPITTEYFEEGAFVLFLPYKMHFGYTDTRQGVVDLQSGGVYVSFRTFEKLYADYSGAYRDNSFYIEKQDIDEMEPFSNQSVSGEPEELEEPKEPEEIEEPEKKVEFRLYDDNAIDSFGDIGRQSATDISFVDPRASAMDIIKNVIEKLPRNKTLDVVIVLDTTRSMKDDIESVQSTIPKMLIEASQGIAIFTIGLVGYKDVNESYLTKRYDFSTSIDTFSQNLKSIKVGGGGDWPEEVFAGLDVAINTFEWTADNKIIFLVGDAPPHDPSKVTSVNKDAIFDAAKLQGIKIYPVLVPKP